MLFCEPLEASLCIVELLLPDELLLEEPLLDDVVLGEVDDGLLYDDWEELLSLCVVLAGLPEFVLVVWEVRWFCEDDVVLLDWAFVVIKKHNIIAGNNNNIFFIIRCAS